MCVYMQLITNRTNYRDKIIVPIISVSRDLHQSGAFFRPRCLRRGRSFVIDLPPMASRDHHGHTHTQPRPQTNTHTHSFKRKGNPDTLHWHSRHLLPSLQIQWQLFLSNPSNPLAHLTHTHAHPVSHTQTDVHRDSWNTHPLLWCWWLRNCHNPFCIDAATVQAERTRLMSGWTGRTGGECTTHWEKRGKWAGEVTEAQREGRSKEMPSRDLHWLYPPLSSTLAPA